MMIGILYIMFVSKNFKVTFFFCFLAFISFLFSDFSISSLEPMLELKKFFLALFEINISTLPSLFPAILRTVCIAVLALFFSSFLGLYWLCFIKMYLYVLFYLLLEPYMNYSGL